MASNGEEVCLRNSESDFISDIDRLRGLACQFFALEVTDSSKTNVAVDSAVVNRLLDQMNSLSLDGHASVDHALRDRLLHSGVAVVVSSAPPTDHLITKFCSLIVKLLKGQKLSCESLVVALVEYHVTILRRQSAWIYPYLLSSLDAVLLASTNVLVAVPPSGPSGRSWTLLLEELVGDDGLLLQLAASADEDDETRRAALKCLEHLALGWSNCLQKDRTRRLISAFLVNLRGSDSMPLPDKFERCTLLISCLVGLRNLVIGLRMSDISALGELLAVLKSLMFYGLFEYNSNSSSVASSSASSTECLYPSPLDQTELTDAVRANSQPSSPGSKSSRSGRSKRWASSQRSRSGAESPYSADDRSPRSSSGSRYQSSWSNSRNSEETDCRDAELLLSLQSRVRSRAIAALTSIFEVVNRKVTFGYFTSFLPSDDIVGASAARGTLVSVFLKDPAQKVRCSALSLLKVMLEGSKPFLGLADDRNRCKTVSFIALSQTVASMVWGVQRALVLALVSETSTPVLTQVLLCVAALVRVAPIQRLSPGFVAKFARHLRPIIDHAESNVNVAALTAFGAIASIEPTLPEVSDVLSNDCGGSWLIDVCVDNLTRRAMQSIPPLPVRIESLQVLAALTRVHFALVRSRLSMVTGVIETGLRDKDTSVNLHSAKLLEEFGRSFMNNSPKSDDDEASSSIDMIVNLYRTLLAAIVVPREGVDGAILCAEFCDCLSTMSARITLALPESERILCKTTLLGLARDEERSVKAAAVRALGAFVLHESIREDCEFLADALEVVIQTFTEDPNVDVKSQAAWTMANVTDALVLLGCERHVGSFVDEVIGDELLFRLCSVALRATSSSSSSSDSNDRVRSNTVRALGNLLRYFGSEHLLKTDFAEITRKSIEVLQTSACSAANMKVRWNACYALGNAFRNDLLLSPSSADDHLDERRATVAVSGDVFVVLSAVAKECKNLKVRINAAAALAVPVRAECYACSIATIVGNLLAGLDNMQSSMSFVEYRHRDDLVLQLCTSVCHLIGLLRPVDVDSVFTVAIEYEKVIANHFGRCVQRRRTDDVEPKRPLQFDTIHDKAVAHLTNLFSKSPLASLTKLIAILTVAID